MLASEWIVDRAVLPHLVQVGTRIAAIDGRIVAVDQVAAGPGARRLHGTLLPGLVDLQVNGAGGRSVDEAQPDALDQVADAVFRGGAVAFLPTLITAPWTACCSRSRRSPRGSPPGTATVPNRSDCTSKDRSS